MNLTLSSLSKSRKQLYLNGPPHLNISLDPPTLLPCPTSSQQVTHMIQVNMVFTLEDKRVLVRELSSSSHLSLPLFPPLPHPISLSPSSLLFLLSPSAKKFFCQVLPRLVPNSCVICFHKCSSFSRALLNMLVSFNCRHITLLTCTG